MTTWYNSHEMALLIVLTTLCPPLPPLSPSPTTVTNDTVKVEVWDVVDKGRIQRKESKGVLKLFNNPAETQVRESSFLSIH